MDCAASVKQAAALRDATQLAVSGQPGGQSDRGL